MFYDGIKNNIFGQKNYSNDFDPILFRFKSNEKLNKTSLKKLVD